jgi:hypothetical protein
VSVIRQLHLVIWSSQSQGVVDRSTHTLCSAVLLGVHSPVVESLISHSALTLSLATKERSVTYCLLFVLLKPFSTVQTSPNLRHLSHGFGKSAFALHLNCSIIHVSPVLTRRGNISCSEYRNMACLCPASRVLACLLLLALIASLAGVPPRAGDSLPLISHLGAKNPGIAEAYSGRRLRTSLHRKLRLFSRENIALHWRYLV